MSTSTRAQDSVIKLNDDLRWARVDLALVQVEPTYQKRFQARHRHWGHALTIADLDMQTVTLDEDRNGAASVVTFAWHADASTSLRQTTIHQRWRRRGRAFYLTNERIITGDEALFATSQSVTD